LLLDNLHGAGLDGVCLITGEADEGNPLGTAKKGIVGAIPCSCIPCAVTTLTNCCCVNYN